MTVQNSGNATGWASALGAKEFLNEDGSVPSPADVEDEGLVHASESTQDGQDEEIELVGSGDTPKDLPEAALGSKATPKAEATQKVSGDKEVITVTDETGRKRSVEIDYTNRDSVKRAFAAAAGMRKFQAERDQALQGRKGIEEELGKLKSDWSTLESAFQQGPEALFDMLQGKKGAFQEHVTRTNERQRFLERASPDEIQALETKERAEAQSKELAKIRKENEEFRTKMTQEREESQTRALESRVHPSFDRYRFDGKLGSADDEQMFDEMLWNSALKRLEPYEKQGLELSPELIEREFRTVAGAIRKRIGVQADKKASQVVAQKKQEATENVQGKMKSAYSADSNEAKLQAAIKSGNTGDIFKNWSSFKNILGGKK